MQLTEESTTVRVAENVTHCRGNVDVAAMGLLEWSVDDITKSRPPGLEVTTTLKWRTRPEHYPIQNMPLENVVSCKWQQFIVEVLDISSCCCDIAVQDPWAMAALAAAAVALQAGLAQLESALEHIDHKAAGSRGTSGDGNFDEDLPMEKVRAGQAEGAGRKGAARGEGACAKNTPLLWLNCTAKIVGAWQDSQLMFMSSWPQSSSWTQCSHRIALRCVPGV